MSRDPSENPNNDQWEEWIRQCQTRASGRQPLSMTFISSFLERTGLVPDTNFFPSSSGLGVIMQGDWGTDTIGRRYCYLSRSNEQLRALFNLPASPVVAFAMSSRMISSTIYTEYIFVGVPVFMRIGGTMRISRMRVHSCIEVESEKVITDEDEVRNIFRRFSITQARGAKQKRL